MRKTIFFLWAVFLFFSTLHAQRVQFKKGDVFIRLSVTDVLNPIENVFLAGAGYMFHPHWSVTADVGYIFLSSENGFASSIPTSGYAFKPALRYHYGKSRRQLIELQGLYKNGTYKQIDWLGMDCINNVPAYEKWTTFKYKKQVAGAVIKWGFMGKLFRRNEKLWYETTAGFSFKSVTEKIIDQPENSCYVRPKDFINSAGLSNTPLAENPQLYVGFKLMYKLK